MIASLRAELMKLRRRSAVWILGAVLVAVVALLGYLLAWWVISHPPPGSELARNIRNLAEAKLAYYPSGFVKNTLSVGGSLGGALCMVLGALTMGSEYSWGTLKTILTQRPGRLAALGGRWVALAVVLAIYAIVVFAVAAGMSAILAIIDGHAVIWPSAGDILKGLAFEWLTFATWAAFGMMLAILFQQSALAIGLGLVYMLIIEGLVLGLLALVGGDAILEIRRILPGTAAHALAGSFPGSSGAGALRGGAPAQALIDAGRATPPGAHCRDLQWSSCVHPARRNGLTVLAALPED